MSSKRNLKRQVRELTWMVDMYADLVDELEAELVDRNEGLDQLIKLCEGAAAVARKATQERDDLMKELIFGEPEDIADKMVNDDSYDILKEERDEYRQKLELAEEREKWNLAEKAAAVKSVATLNEFYKGMEARYNAALSAQTRLEQERGQLAEALGRTKHAAEYWKLLWEYNNTPTWDGMMTEDEYKTELARLKDLAGLG